MKRFIQILLLFYCGCASAQVIQDSVKIHFRTGYSNLDMNLGKNREVLEDIKDKIQLNADDSIYYRLQKVLVVGGASPEGSIPLNKRLSEKRAETLFNYLARYGTFPDSIRHFNFLGRDWEGLYRLADDDLNLPFRDETLALLREIKQDAKNNVGGKTDAVWRLQALRGGQPYRYMYREHFPALRASGMYLWYRPVVLPPFSAHTSLKKCFDMPVPTLTEPAFTVLEPEKEKEPFYWALKTNLLYDAALVPNIGAEFYLGKNWSAGANWMYAWWSHDTKHRYWRIYGGDIYLRKWFGKAAAEKPLTGHHIGVYGQALTYDFETGGRGYMGGKPGGTLWDQADYVFGVEYGYSLPIARRLNLDFTLGVGYWGGKYHEYLPEDDCYVWQITKKRKWFGPTKAEVSLVWLLGRDNYNKKKGGER